MSKAPISDGLRDAIAAAIKKGLTLSEIARAAGTSSQQVGRLLRGERGVSLLTADELARVLDLELKRKARK